MVLEGKRPPYVPWHFKFTKEPLDKLSTHFGTKDVDSCIDDHVVELGSAIGFFTDLGNDRFQDVFGVVWDRSIDKDIGNPEAYVLPEPTFNGYELPNPLDRRFFQDIPEKIAKYHDCFRLYCLGFSLFERAWTLRGMENLYMDFYEHPDFVQKLFDAIVDYNITQIREALKYDIDAVYFGDDWGQQHGLLMGPKIWKKFIWPRLKRMYDVVRKAGKFVVIHSCGDVDELFDDLVDIGLNCFNPLQPEVMDVETLMKQYQGRLSFYGGLSVQKTLPHGSVDDVRRESRKLLELGSEGGYIFAPAHDVPKGVKLENMLAFINEARSQLQYVLPKTRAKQKLIEIRSKTAKRPTTDIQPAKATEK